MLFMCSAPAGSLKAGTLFAERRTPHPPRSTQCRPTTKKAPTIPPAHTTCDKKEAAGAATPRRRGGRPATPPPVSPVSEGEGGTGGKGERSAARRGEGGSLAVALNGSRETHTRGAGQKVVSPAAPKRNEMKRSRRVGVTLVGRAANARQEHTQGGR